MHQFSNRISKFLTNERSEYCFGFNSKQELFFSESLFHKVGNMRPIGDFTVCVLVNSAIGDDLDDEDEED